MLTSRDSARKTLSKIPFSIISRFSSLYKSRLFARQPKNSQTFGTLNEVFCDLISSSSCQKLLKGAVPVPIVDKSKKKPNFPSISKSNWIHIVFTPLLEAQEEKSFSKDLPGPMRMIGWDVSFGKWKLEALLINNWISSSFSSPSK